MKAFFEKQQDNGRMQMATTTQQQAAPASPIVYPASPMPTYYLGDKMACGPMGTIANPAPLGLNGFALTTFVLSCYNAGIFGVMEQGPVNVIIGLALFYGGLAQGLAGMWEFRTGNTFGATAFTSYAAFWLSYAVILIPGFGVLQAYTGVSASSLSPAIATFLLAWTIFTFLMLLASFRTSLGLILLFAALTVTFVLLTIAEFRQSAVLLRAGGFMGIATAVIAWYNALAGLFAEERYPFVLPVGKVRTL